MAELGGDRGVGYTAFVASPDAACVFDASQGRCERNAAFEAAFGTDVDALAAFERASPGLARLVQRLVSEREPFDADDVRARSIDQSERRWWARGRVLSDGAALVVCTDVTARISASTARAHADRLAVLARFSAGVSHDLRNVLSAVCATAEAALAESTDPALHADLRAILESAERGATLADALRALGPAETGSWRAVDLGAEVRAAAAVLIRGPGAVPITLDLAPDAPWVIGDRARLHQLVFNLIVNARDAARSSGGGVEVSLANLGPAGLTLSVLDDGPGVSPELRSRIFEPYFSTKAPDDESSPARGLGLAVVAAVARATGAAVAVSDRETRGACFSVSWPLSTLEPRAAVASGPAPAPLEPACVLVADDEAALTGAVTRHLRRAGHSVYAALSAGECRQLFETHADGIDVAVLDVILGDGDGRELALELLAKKPQLGVVLVSAARHKLDVPRDPRLATLAKPFDVAALSAAIASARQAAR